MRKRQETSQIDLIDHYTKLYDGTYGLKPTPAHKIVANSVSLLRRAEVKTILDVGAGRGHTLEIFQKNGFDVAGTEVVQSLLQSDLVSWMTFPYSATEIKQLGADAYDLVSLIDILDHLANFEESIDALKQAFFVAKIGVLVTVNNLDSRERTIKQDNAFWRVEISERCPMGAVDILAREEVMRIIAWKKRRVHSSRSET